MSMLSFRMEAAGGPIRARAAALWRGVRRIIGWPWRVAAARRDMADLARLSDHELADIGLSGQDLRDARGLRLDENPSLLLTRRARERARRMY